MSVFHFTLHFAIPENKRAPFVLSNAVYRALSTEDLDPTVEFDTPDNPETIIVETEQPVDGVDMKETISRLARKIMDRMPKEVQLKWIEPSDLKNFEIFDGIRWIDLEECLNLPKPTGARTNRTSRSSTTSPKPSTGPVMDAGEHSR